MITPNGGVFGRHPTFDTLTVRSGIVSTGTAAAPTSNTVIGQSAGAALQSGAVNNVLVGASAGDAITTADDCVAIGSNALGANQTASSSVAIGSNALLLNTAASMTAVGVNALDANTTGTGNVAIGAAAAVEVLDALDACGEQCFAGGAVAAK